jgi:tRNA(fMet)-specific endonuclease VapC
LRRFLLDTGIASHYINRRRGVFERAREEVVRGNDLGIAIPVLGELYAGIEASASRDRNMLLLRRAIISLKLWPFDIGAAEEFGRISAELRRIARPIQQIDMQIAAIARSLGRCTVVSADSDFKALPGLDVEDWS